MFENKIIEFLNTIADWILLSLLGLLGSIFIVTIPVAFASMCHVISRVFIKGRGSVVSEFIKSYIHNLKKMLIVTLVNIGIGIVLILPLWYLYPTCSEMFLFQTYEISVFLLCVLSIVNGLRVFSAMAVKNLSWKKSLAVAGNLLKKPILSICLMFFVLLAAAMSILYPPVLCITPALLASITIKTGLLVEKTDEQ